MGTAWKRAAIAIAVLTPVVAAAGGGYVLADRATPDTVALAAVPKPPTTTTTAKQPTSTTAPAVTLPEEIKPVEVAPPPVPTTFACPTGSIVFAAPKTSFTSESYGRTWNVSVTVTNKTSREVDVTSVQAKADYQASYGRTTATAYLRATQFDSSIPAGASKTFTGDSYISSGTPGAPRVTASVDWSEYFPISCPEPTMTGASSA